MVQNFQYPPFGFGPGSQPSDNTEDGRELAYLPLPTRMETFEPNLPEIEDPEKLAPALGLMTEIAEACANCKGAARSFDLGGLDAENRALIDETFGRGEVSCRVETKSPVDIDETVFAGIWRVRGKGYDGVEISPIPEIVTRRAFEPSAPAMGPLTPKLPGVFNAPALITEFMEKSRDWKAGELPHVVNLTLLPHTPEDLEFLKMALGKGSVSIISRGYGDCKIEATGLPNVWRVQFFNSMGVLILDTYEVTTIPEVALAADEDFEDSAERLFEVLEAIR